MARNPLKPYEGTIQFQTIGIKVKAKNLTEAKKKIRAKVEKLKPARLLDKDNCFYEEI